MVEVLIGDKMKYLALKYPFSKIPVLTDKRFCLVCKQEFIVGNYKVMKDDSGREHICCPDAPDCKGTVLDWMSK